jgi:hypothetical protein
MVIEFAGVRRIDPESRTHVGGVQTDIATAVPNEMNLAESGMIVHRHARPGMFEKGR